MVRLSPTVVLARVCTDPCYGHSGYVTNNFGEPVVVLVVQALPLFHIAQAR